MGSPHYRVGVHDLVWYVAYGSNKVAGRLACYLEGGRPEGSRRTYRGARDRSLPRRSLNLQITHRMFFAGESPVWGGGVAFIDIAPDPGADTDCVSWLITLEQLSDLVAQECGGEAPGPDLARLPDPGEAMVVAQGRYDTLLGLGPIDGVAAVLVTSSDPPAPSDPSPAYLELVERSA